MQSSALLQIGTGRFGRTATSHEFALHVRQEFPRYRAVLWFVMAPAFSLAHTVLGVGDVVHRPTDTHMAAHTASYVVGV